MCEKNDDVLYVSDPFEKGGKNENGRIAFPDSELSHLQSKESVCLPFLLL